MTTAEFSWGVRSDVGRVREVNQDSVHAHDGLFVVADGMGGHSGGEVASAVAIEKLVEANVDGTPDIHTLVETVRLAHAAILDRAATERDLTGMGTTLCAIARLEDDPSMLGLVNVGDSRIYRFTDGELQQISEDHSLVGDLVRTGQLSPDEAAVHPRRNIVTRALGIGQELLIDYWEVPAKVGDRYLLCSDGLVDEVPDNQIAAVMRRLDDPDQIVDELVRLAHESGSRDNVTVLVVRIDDADVPAVEMPTGPRVSAPAGPPSSTASTGAPVADTGVDSGVAAGAAPSEEEHAPHRRPIPVRGVVLALLVVAIIAAGLWLIGVYARSNYFVGFERDQVVVYQGRPGGVLWYDATVEEGGSLFRDDLSAALQLEIDANPEFGSLDDARSYLEGLVDRAAGQEPRVESDAPLPTPPPTPSVGALSQTGELDG